MGIAEDGREVLADGVGGDTGYADEFRADVWADDTAVAAGTVCADAGEGGRARGVQYCVGGAEGGGKAGGPHGLFWGEQCTGSQSVSVV